MRWTSSTLPSLAGLVAVALLSGCVGPIRDPIGDQFRTAFINKYAPPGGIALPKVSSAAERNEFIDGYVAVKNLQYANYIGALRRGAGFSELGADGSRLVLDGLAAVTGSSGLKSALAAASAGITGITSAVKKDLLFDKAVPTFVAKMEELRAAKLTDITEKKKRSLAGYTLLEAFNDVQEYGQLGTLDTAITALNGTSSAAANTAKVLLADRKGDRATQSALASVAPVLPTLGDYRAPTKTPAAQPIESVTSKRIKVYELFEKLADKDAAAKGALDAIEADAAIARTAIGLRSYASARRTEAEMSALLAALRAQAPKP